MCTCHTTVHVYNTPPQHLHEVVRNQACPKTSCDGLIPRPSYCTCPGDEAIWACDHYFLSVLTTGYRPKSWSSTWWLPPMTLSEMTLNFSGSYINFPFCNLVTRVHRINTERTLARSSVLMIDLIAWSCAHTTQLTIVQSKTMVCESGKSLLTHLVTKHLIIAFLQHHRCMYYLASYSVVFFYRSVSWNYCILDEGHIIKNTKTKVWTDTPTNY